MDSQRTVGIDFGTSTNFIAEREGEEPSRILPLGRSERWIPSVAWVDQGGAFKAGEEAETALPADRLIRSIKRAITREVDHVLVESTEGTDEIPVRDVVEAILAETIAAARRHDPAYFDRSAIHLGCPAMWRRPQRELLTEVATDLGLRTSVGELLDEPIAAGVSWIWDRWQQDGDAPEGRVVVVDYGGGTLDVACLEVHGGASPEITVLGAEGDDLAGDDLDDTIAEAIEEDLIEAGISIDDLPDPIGIRRALRISARRLKERLSDQQKATEVIPGYDQLPNVQFTRDRLEELFQPQLDRMINVLTCCLRASELRKLRSDPSANLRQRDLATLASDVSYILLAGGLSKVPAVAKTLADNFPRAVVAADTSVDSPQQAVVSGLTFARAYAQLNLHRPAFDIKVRYTEQATGRSAEQPIYAAYEPLYTREQVLLGDTHLGISRTLRAPKGIAGKVAVELLGEAVDGTPIDFKQAVEGQPEVGGVRFDAIAGPGRSGHLKLYVHGQLVMHIPGSEQVNLRMENWPVVHAADYTIPVTPVPRQPWEAQQDIPGWWHGGEQPGH